MTAAFGGVPVCLCDRLNYYRGGLSYLGDMWALHITNTGFKWEKVGVGRDRRVTWMGHLVLICDLSSVSLIVDSHGYARAHVFGAQGGKLLVVYTY